jgi:zinc protease
MLRSLFSGWRGKAHPLKTLAPAAKKKEQHVERKIFQTHMVFSFLGPGLASDERYAAEVMDAVLSGMGGRIHRRLREERPYAYALTFFNQMAYETAALGIYIGTDLKYVDEIRKVVNAEIEQIHKDGFTGEEIANAKRYLVGNHRTRMQTNSAIASSMCLDTIYGLKADFFKRWPALIEKVTKEEVDAVARKYLATDKMVVIQLGPTPEKQ